MLFFRVTPTGGNGDGDNYLDITGTLAAGETEITLTDSHIETDGIYDFYTSKYGVVPTDVEIAASSVTLTFDVQSENIIVMVRKWGESGGGSHSLTFTTLLNEKINAANVTKTLSDSIQNYDALIFRFGDSTNDSSFPERQTRNVFVNDINFCIENNLHYTISWATNYITLDFSGTDSVTSNLTRGLTIYEIIGVKY